MAMTCHVGAWELVLWNSRQYPKLLSHISRHYYLFTYLETGFLCIVLADLELTLLTSLASNSQRSACLSLPSADLKVCATTSRLVLLTFEIVSLVAQTDLRLAI